MNEYRVNLNIETKVFLTEYGKYLLQKQLNESLERIRAIVVDKSTMKETVEAVFGRMT